jgi:hypothetical protein
MSKRMVLHRTPVSVRHPVTGQYLGLRRGDELDEADPIALDPTFAWLFEDTPEPEQLASVRLDNEVEQATAAPGERRSTRRPARKAAGE